MRFFGAFATFLVLGSVSGDLVSDSPEAAASLKGSVSDDDLQTLGQMVLKLSIKMHQQFASRHFGRRLQTPAMCWDDCPGGKYDDNHTVCGKPDRCTSMKETLENDCITDCKSRMEILRMCETKTFCVDQKGEGDCPLTLALVQGATDNPDAVRCSACVDKSSKMNSVLEMAGIGTMDLNVDNMVMGMVTEDMCPKTVAAGDCALANPECLDSKTSTDGSFLLFGAMCDCPCGRKMAKFLWDLGSMTYTACSKGIKNGFKEKMPGVAEMGTLLFASGLLECMGCDWNKKACSKAVDKWLSRPEDAGSSFKALISTLEAMAGNCDEETTTTPTTTTTTTTTAAPADPPDFSSDAAYYQYIVGVVSALAASLLA